VHGWIEAHGERVEVTPAVAVDALDFIAAIEAGEDEEALLLSGGAFLAGCHLGDSPDFESGVDRRQSHLARLHRDLCRRLTAARIEKGDAEGARAVAERWAEMDPLDDEAHHRIIDLLARTGRRSQALRHYEEYRELIARELEVEPLDQTRELVARMREGEAAPGRAREQSEAPLRNAPPEPRPPPVAATRGRHRGPHTPGDPERGSAAGPKDDATRVRCTAGAWLAAGLAGGHPRRGDDPALGRSESPSPDGCRR
jgi:hypothetical protein